MPSASSESSVKDLAAVKSDGTPHPSATPPPSPNADARGRQKIDFRMLCGKCVIRLKSAKNSDIILVSAKRKGDFMQFILTFSAIYILGALIGQNMRIFIREPKLIHIKSPIIYTFLTFPVCVIAGKAVLAKNQKLMLSELMCCIFNQIVLVGTVILQVIPPVPCEVIELTFGLRHQGLDIVLDTYNQKIPLGAVLALLCAEVLGDHDPCPNGYSHEKNQQEVEYWSCTSNRSKSIVANVFAHDNTVNCVIQLLEHISYEHGYHEFDDLANRVALRHVYRLK
jgi:hypothetical protein